MIIKRDGWEWDTEDMIDPTFPEVHRRRESLRHKGQLTAREQTELTDGYRPEMYWGATYNGFPVSVARSLEKISDDWFVETGDRIPYLVNNPRDFARYEISTKRYPQGPPGWVGLKAGVHWDPAQPQVASVDRFRRFAPPWDVEIQRMLAEGLPPSR